MADDYRDLETFILHSAAAPSIHLLRPLFSRWRRQLLENGVERVSIRDAVAANLMTAFISDAVPRPNQSRSAMHDHRNLLWAQGVPMLEDRGWKP